MSNFYFIYKFLGNKFILGSKQHGGYKCCDTCHNFGVYIVRSDAINGTMYYPFSCCKGKPPKLKTHQQVVDDILFLLKYIFFIVKLFLIYQI